MANSVRIMANVESIEKHGAGTYEVKFRPKGRVPRFKAGQFLHLSVDEYDPAGGFWPESRVFSIASRSGDELITIVYSVKGRYTKLMEERLFAGREVWLKLPFGDFTIESRVHEGADLVLVAGGTGISPFAPYLEALAEGENAGRKVRLYYGLRSPDQLLFVDTLARCREKGVLDLRIWLESGESSIGGLAGLEPGHGRLDADRLFEECLNMTAPDFFLSGPPAMIKSFKTVLLAKGLDDNKILMDEWE